jgi:radical SAM protein with 4Fe4S-binding SPASM domain
MMIIKQEENSFHVYDVLGEMGIWELDLNGLEQYLHGLERKRAAGNAKVQTFPLLENTLRLHNSDENRSAGDNADDAIFSYGLPESCFFDTGKVLENARTLEKGIITPPSVSIEVNSICNYTCRWCCADVHKEERGLTLSLEDIEDRIVRPMAQAGNLTWYIAGGEPALTVQRTASVAQMIRQHTAEYSVHSPFIALDSNGTGFRKNVRLFKESGINTIQFSLSSPYAEKDKYFRGVPSGMNSVETVADAIRAAKEHSLHCGINMVLWKEDEERQNLSDVDEMIRFGTALEADFIRITPAVPGSVSEQHGMKMQEQDMREVGQRLGNLHLNGSGATKVLSILTPSEDPAEEASDRPMMCRAGTCFVHVDHKGDVFPCVMVMPEFRIGNVVQDDLAQLWYAEKSDFALWREAVEIAPECAACSERNYCVGKCPAYAWFKFRDLTLASGPPVCAASTTFAEQTA